MIAPLVCMRSTTPDRSEIDSREILWLHTKIFCPEWRLAADVAIGLDRSGPKTRLAVVSCDLLREGESRDLTCAEGIAAQA